MKIKPDNIAPPDDRKSAKRDKLRHTRRRSRATSPTASQSETACTTEVGMIEILGGSAFRPVFMGNLRVSIDPPNQYS